jgi:hypothetical protein
VSLWKNLHTVIYKYLNIVCLSSLLKSSHNIGTSG